MGVLSVFSKRKQLNDIKQYICAKDKMFINKINNIYLLIKIFNFYKEHNTFQASLFSISKEYAKPKIYKLEFILALIMSGMFSLLVLNNSYPALGINLYICLAIVLFLSMTILIMSLIIALNNYVRIIKAIQKYINCRLECRPKTLNPLLMHMEKLILMEEKQIISEKKSENFTVTKRKRL